MKVNEVFLFTALKVKNRANMCIPIVPWGKYLPNVTGTDAAY